MELKSYDKAWLPAFKGAFLILFGIIGILRVYGSVKTLAVFFILLITMIAVLLIGAPILYKKMKFRRWTTISGLLNLGFGIFLLLKIESTRMDILWGIFAWVIFYAITEIIEAGILIFQNNAFFALFVLNALLTLLFGYFLYVVILNFTLQGVFYIGLIALVFGITNELSSFLLSRFKEN
jgi:hypothetical protein